MSSHRWIRCFLLSALFLLVTSFTYAQTCSDTWTASCTSTNTCPAPGQNPPIPSCTVQISHDSNNNAVIQYNNTTVSDICAYPNQTIVWTEHEPSTANFVLTFQSTATPFTNSTATFSGSTGTNAQGTLVSSPSHGCYKFSIEQTVGANKYSADPKVVIHGSGGK